MQNEVSKQKILELLQKNKTIAVVGLSDNPDRASYRVAQYLKNHGYRIIPVNPQLKTCLGETAYPDLLSIPDKVDIVNVFRRSEDVPPIIDDALKIKPNAVWLQLDIINHEAAAMCECAGISIIMDKCIKIEHARLSREDF